MSRLFTDENHNMPEAIEASKLNSWVFNRDTIKAVLNTLMTDGIRIDYGQKLGRQLYLQKNHDHAEKFWKYSIRNTHISRIMRK